jgi:hypothetical protein
MQTTRVIVMDEFGWSERYNHIMPSNMMRSPYMTQYGPAGVAAANATAAAKAAGTEMYSNPTYNLTAGPQQQQQLPPQLPAMGPAGLGMLMSSPGAQVRGGPAQYSPGSGPLPPGYSAT